MSKFENITAEEAAEYFGLDLIEHLDSSEILKELPRGILMDYVHSTEPIRDILERYDPPTDFLLAYRR